MILSSIAKFRVAWVREVGHFTIEVFIFVVLGFVTEKNIHVVVAKRAVPVQQLVAVESAGACAVLVATAAYASCVATDWSSIVGLTSVEHVVCNVCSELEVVEEVSFQVATRAEVVASGLVDIFFSYSQWVLLRSIRTNIFGTEVVANSALFVAHQVAISVIQIDRIDRRDALREQEDVRIVGTNLAIETVLDGVGISNVTTNLEVFTNLLVNLNASRNTVERRTYHVTFVAQIAQRNVSLSVFSTTGYVDVIFLTSAVVEWVLCPVVVPLIGLSSRIEFACGRVDELVIGYALKLVVLQIARNKVLGYILACTSITHLFNQAVTD